MFTDPIADMLTRIRNAQAVKKTEVFLPYSKLKFNLLNLLVAEGWLKKVEIIEPSLNIKNKKQVDKSLNFKRLKLEIVYQPSGQPKISSLKRISKPGRRIYSTKENLPTVRNGWGLAVISTSQGLMTDHEAKQKKLGGEVICEIY